MLFITSPCVYILNLCAFALIFALCLESKYISKRFCIYPISLK
ncbi:Hypothetical protein BN2458_PEG0860 [Helicobacter typhlonius]|uniref:Uncharacterized protein n=1 Tax=Helicobacter typhlonius TaxID=76936 RepID=A0A0S4PX13_9HELI|nr:Hypothetical protein BN2458_PEG0860 [Helicobacter typhlonius]